MACITISVEKSFKERLDRFPWVNWSQISREELLKRYIFHNYLKTGNLTKEEERFCETIDWHPLDELPIKEEYIKKLERMRKGPRSKPMNSTELKNWFEEL